MRFKKIKITSDEKIHLEYEEENRQGSFDEYSFTSSEKPRPEFYKAMQDLAEFVCEICEFPSEDVEKIAVRGVSFSYAGEDDTMGAVITAQKELIYSNCPLNINTPHKPSDFYSEQEGDPDQLLSSDCVYALEELIEEAEKYIDGERAQIDMFSEEEPVEEEAEPVES